ncbi:hypothetical protein D3C72_2047700 [compost metagenome]
MAPETRARIASIVAELEPARARTRLDSGRPPFGFSVSREAGVARNAAMSPSLSLAGDWKQATGVMVS